MTAPRLILDLSRTLSRASQPVPTGIDRVEMAYAQYLLAHHRDRLEFAALHPVLGCILLLPSETAAAFVAATAERWKTSGDCRRTQALARRLHIALPPRVVRGPSAYLLMSHHHLDRRFAIERFLRRTGAAFVCLVHDLIPIEFPEYGRPGQAEIHRKRMQTVAALADAIVTNSTATSQSLQPFLDRAGRKTPVLTALLGVDVHRDVSIPASSGTSRPYFVCIGTIEPRKNHLLLLHIWRRLAAESDTPPLLVIIGRRGWENENVIDIIERCEVLRGVVKERNAVSDAEMRDLLTGARALLLPSFAEGYGLPLAEALAVGVPVLCSDLPALREVGLDVPEYLDPLDGIGWLDAISQYALAGSERRAAQLARLETWTAPDWDVHFHAAMNLIQAGSPLTLMRRAPGGQESVRDRVPS